MQLGPRMTRMLGLRVQRIDGSHCPGTKEYWISKCQKRSPDDQKQAPDRSMSALDEFRALKQFREFVQFLK
jgi:hypothetical protein